MTHESIRIGVDLGGTKIEAAALDPDGEIIARRRTATPAEDYGAIVRAIGTLVRDVELELNRKASVGVATPGVISPRSGLIKNSNTTALNGKPLDRDLSAALERPVRIENDANCFALSEAVDGAAAHARVVFGAILGTGVGGGLVVDGRTVSGPDRGAGEWGHNPLPWMRGDEYPGRRCYCGHDGCMETFLSGPALSYEFSKRSGKNCTGEEIAALAEAGDRQALASLELYQDRLARGFASIVNVLDPDVIVVGGGISNIARIYEGLHGLVEDYALTDALGSRIVKNMHGDSSGVRGAAWLWNPGAAGG
jgi:fructokinase